MRASRALLATIGLVTVLSLCAACGGQHATDGTAQSKGTAGSAAPLSLSSTTGTPPVPGGPVRVDGALPAPPSTSAQAYALTSGPASRQQVTALARALGITATPVHAGTGWTATSAAGQVLRVADTAGRPWILGDQNGQVPVPVPTATPGDTGTDLPPAAGRSAAAAKAALDAVLAATGRSGDPVVVTGAAPGALAAAEHRVDGLLAVGFGSQLSVGARGSVVAGSGWLGTPTGHGRYPVISAKEALKRLPATPPGMMHPDYCVRTAEGAACAGQPRTVTGARLGLLLAHDTHGSALLVPAWLFTVQGQAAPLAVVAVADAQLQTPSPSPSR